MAKYLKSPLLNYDVLATAARQPGIYSLGRRALSYSRVQYTYRDDARRHDSSQGVKISLKTGTGINIVQAKNDGKETELLRSHIQDAR